MAAAGDDHSSSLAIAGGVKRPTRKRRMGHPASLFGLAPCGVLPATRVATRAVRSYRTFSPLPDHCWPGGMFSVPLSFGLPRPGVTRRTALRSSDFPPTVANATVSDRLARCERSSVSAVAFLRDLILLEFLVQVASRRIDDFSRFRNVPAVLAQLRHQERPFGVVLEFTQRSGLRGIGIA